MEMPPFPDDDLAKLVLGYLAEEQLMTIYDEFLQASPYLDAFENEYDRILMTSLRTILAEYRAVKIYLETCKPFSLRKKLLQCANLLEVVKFLIRHVDVQRLSESDFCNTTRNSRVSQTVQLSQSICRICQSRKPNKCKCGVPPSHQNLNESMEAFVEQKNMIDLSGNRAVTLIDSSDREYCTSPSLPHSYKCEREEKNTSEYQNITVLSSTAQCETKIPSDNSYSTVPKLYDHSIRLLETSVHVQNTDEMLRHGMEHEHSNDHQDHLETSEAFQECASGVEGSDKCISTVNVFTSNPSITRSTITYYRGSNVQEALFTSPFNMPTISTTNSNKKPGLLLQIGNLKSNDTHNFVDIDQTGDMASIKNDESLPQTSNNSVTLKKPAEQKIEILSNVKLQQKSLMKTASKRPETSFTKSQSKMPGSLRGVSTATHTIYVNGTPAYKPQTENGVEKTFTEDEIMAMPTLILVPVKGIPSYTSSANSITTITSTDSSTKFAPTAYLPLNIDINSPDSKSQDYRPSASKMANADEIIHNIDANKIEPKGGIVNDLSKTSTPYAPCEIKKSSSTPRRSSHIRVLDFNTPSQINEKETMKQSDLFPKQSPDSKSLPILETIALEVEKNIVYNRAERFNKKRAKMKKSESKNKREGDSITNVLQPSKSNWDAQLRAFIPLTDPQDEQIQSDMLKCVKNKKIGEKERKKNNNTKISDKKKSIKKSKPKTVKEKKDSPEESIEELVQKQINSVEVPVKPTINIITDRNTVPMQSEKNDKEMTADIQNTPEMDRIALQTACGAKLNISDLFETPYKQALYDIQMDTPKFLAPDIPGEPISDVKIMNIPTPKFLSTPRLVITPKLSQNTPVPYVSRSTDYSSGGSYYKPDEQDYACMIDDIENIPISESNLTDGNPIIDSEGTEVAKTNRALRPVRRCTKNVSYYDNTISISKKKSITETENINNHSDLDSISNLSIDCANVDKNTKSTMKMKKTNKKSQVVSSNTDDIKKKLSVARKKKSSSKKSSFIKIKPRRPTPTKLVKGKRKSPILTQKESMFNLSKKSTTIKDKSAILLSQLAVVPTKSRRKSSTPRKINCTEELNSDSSSNISPGSNKLVVTGIVSGKNTELCSEDTDTPHLHWSDDGSQDSKRNDTLEIEDITKIKEYIVSTEVKKSSETDIPGGSSVDETLHVNLVKRGFDFETAKSIERDLLENSPSHEIADRGVAENINLLKSLESSSLVKEASQKQPDKIGTDNDNAANVTENSECNLIKERCEEELDDCVEFSVTENSEESDNYFKIEHDGANRSENVENSVLSVKLKDNFCMEACMEDGVTIRLKLTACTTLFSEEPASENNHNDTIESDDIKEIENAVSSISGIDRLYTPLKDTMSAESQCIEIFDTTPVNADTPLKTAKEKEIDKISTEVTLEIEETSSDSSRVTKKRKRIQSEKSLEELPNDSKRNKTETQYLASVQNFDIESVLNKLHGS